MLILTLDSSYFRPPPRPDMMVCKLISAIILNTLNYGTFALQSSRFRGKNKKIKILIQEIFYNHILSFSGILSFLFLAAGLDSKVSKFVKIIKEKKRKDTIATIKAKMMIKKSCIRSHGATKLII